MAYKIASNLPKSVIHYNGKFIRVYHSESLRNINGYIEGDIAPGGKFENMLYSLVINGEKIITGKITKTMGRKYPLVQHLYFEGV